MANLIIHNIGTTQDYWTLDPYIRHKVLSIVQARQEGKCYHCGKLIHDNESIVSCGRRKSYYHKSCAQRLNIIWALDGGIFNMPSFNRQLKLETV